MTDKKSSESRRKLLKSIAAGSGAIVAGKSLPDSWSRPVVDSVMLPAHAETSPPGESTRTYSGNVTRASIDSGNDSMLTKAIDSFITSAEAQGGGGGGGGWYVCVTVSGSMANVTLAGLNYDETDPTCTGIIRSGSIATDGTPGTITGVAIEASDCQDWDPNELTAEVGINPANTSDTVLALVIYPKLNPGNPFELSVPVSPTGECAAAPSICTCPEPQ